MAPENSLDQPDDFAALIDSVEGCYMHFDSDDVTVLELACAAEEFGLASLIATFDSLSSLKSEVR